MSVSVVCCVSEYRGSVWYTRKRSLRRLCFYCCLSVHMGQWVSAFGPGGVSTTSPWADTSLLRRSPGQTPPGRQPLSADTPLGRHAQADTSLGRHPLWADTLPCPVYARIHTPFPVHAGIWSISRRYTSHCHAFLFIPCFRVLL